MSFASLGFLQALLPRRLYSRLLFAIFVPLALTVISGLAGYRALRLTLDAESHLQRLGRVVERTEDLWKLLVDAQVGVRGFALSGNESFLAPYEEAVRRWPSAVAELEALVGEQPDQVARLHAIEGGFNALNKGVAEVVVAARRGTPPEHVDAALAVRSRLIHFGLATSRWQNRRTVPEASVKQAFTDFRIAVETARRTAGREDLRAAWSTVSEKVGAFERTALAGLHSREAERAAEDLVSATVLVSDLTLQRAREALLPITSGEAKAALEQVRVDHEALIAAQRAALATETDRIARHRAAWTGAAFGGWLTAAVLGILIAVAFARRMMAPIRSIARAAEAIERGELKQRAEVFADDEAGRLATSFNRMAERLDRRDREVSRLHELSQLLQTAADEAEAFEIFERLTPLLLPGSSGSVHTISASRVELDLRTRFGPFADRLAGRASPADCWALRQGHAYLVPDADRKLVCAHLGGRDGLRDPYVCVPLVTQGETIGLLHTSFPAGALDEPLEARATEIEGIANALALALGNLGLREKLRAQSVRDPLTGLFNRRYLEETLPRELDRCRRRGQPLVLAMADLDHFKRLNDTWGHEAGDRFLQRFAEALRRHFRSEDVICRYGGEEFCFVLPDCPIERARERCESLLVEMRGATVEVGRESAGPVTVSVGLAEFESTAETAEPLLRRADAALYAAKRSGRDRIVAHAPLPADAIVAIA